MGVLIAVATAAAMSVAASQEARELGYIVGTAEMCGIKLNASKVARVVTERMDALGPEARSTFEIATTGRKFRLRQMGEIERATACAMHEAGARRYGLID